MPERFLIVKPSSLGDIIHTFPAVTHIASAFPDAEFDWLAAPAFADIVRYHPRVKNAILFRRKELGKFRSFLPELWSLRRELRREPYSAVLDFQGLMRSAVLSRFARAGFYWGPRNPREKLSSLFYSGTMSYSEYHAHAVMKNLEMAAEFCGKRVPEKVRFEMPVNREASESVKRKIKGVLNGRVIAVSPGARWKTKQWPVSFFAGVIARLQARYRDCTAVILGSKDEKELGFQLSEQIKIPSADLCGETTICELVEAIRLSKICLCNDSGPMHIAAALNVPSFTAFGPTDPVLTGPFSDVSCVLTPRLDCVKCFRRECADCRCHEMISAEEAAESLIRR